MKPTLVLHAVALGILVSATTTVSSQALSVFAGRDTAACGLDTLPLGVGQLITGGVGPLTYQWQPAALVDNPNVPNPMAWPATTTDFELTVTDSLGNTKRDTINYLVDYDCVYPGDCDKNLIVDVMDMVYISPYFGAFWNLPGRLDRTNVFKATPSPDIGSQTPNGIDLKHVDCHGDASINSNDYSVLIANFSYSGIQPATIGQPGDPILRLDLPDTMYSGQTYKIKVFLGENVPVSDAAGVVFDLALSDTVVQLVGSQMQAINGYGGQNHFALAYANKLFIETGGYVVQGAPISGAILEATFTVGSLNQPYHVTHLDVTSAYGIDHPKYDTLWFEGLGDSVRILDTMNFPLIHLKAGRDTASCSLDTLPLANGLSVNGGTGPLTFQWQPAAFVSDPNILNPMAWPNVTTDFVLTVTDSLGVVQTDTINFLVDEDCVLPGDCDKNGIVDISDIVYWQSGFNTFGWKPRLDQSTTFTLRPAPPSMIYTPDSVDYKHLDASGDADINSLDANVIIQNYSYVGPQPMVIGDAGDPILRVELPPVMYSGQDYEMILHLGENIPVSDLAGLIADFVVSDSTLRLGSNVSSIGNYKGNHLLWGYPGIEFYESGGYVDSSTGTISGAILRFPCTAGALQNFEQTVFVDITTAFGMDHAKFDTLWFEGIGDSVLIIDTINFPPPLSLSMDPGVTKCEKDTIDMANHVQVSGGRGAVTYSWTPVAHLSDPSIEHPLAYPPTTTLYRLTASDTTGVILEDSILVSIDSTCVSGIELSDRLEGFEFYPNPTSATLQLRWVGLETLTVHITDMSGRSLWTHQLAPQSSEQLVLDEWSPGTYIIHYGHGQGRSSQRFVLIR